MLILLELVYALGAVLFSVVTLFFMCFAVSNEFREAVHDWIDDYKRRLSYERFFTG